MTNITKLYQQLQEGKTTRDYFVREARRQFPQFISPVSSFDDVVSILKGKRLVSENLTKEVSGAMFDAPPTLDEEDEDKIEELDTFSDPVLMRMRAKKDEPIQAPKQDPNKSKISMLLKKRAELEREMEQVAEPEGGPIADEYGEKLNRIDVAIARLRKQSLQEAHKLDTEQILDRMSPYAVKKGIEVELKKEKVIDHTTLDKVRTKVARKLKKNPKAYEDLVTSNAKAIEKVDKDLETKELKQELVDKKNAMVKPKGFKADKPNTKTSNKENKRGKPKGVKVMPDKGVTGSEKVMKEDVLKNLKSSLIENMMHTYTKNTEVYTPEGPGVVKDVKGGTLTIELENGNLKDFQINIIDKATRDAKFGGMKGFGDTLQKTEEESTKKPTYEDKLKSIVERIGKLKDKEKAKKMLEAIEQVVGKDSTGNEVTLAVTDQGKGQPMVNRLKSQGAKSVKVNKIQ